MAVSFGLGGMALLVGFVAVAARRSFLGRIESLQRALDKAPKVLAVRTDIPSEVVALARRLGVSDGGGGRLVRLTQSGEMWLKPGSKPLAFKAEQTIAVAEVGFLWRAWIKMAGVSMQVIDYTVGCKAGLEGCLFDTLPMMRMTDTDSTFRGEAMRYLAELMWNPDALLLNRWLDWRVINVRTLAVATSIGALLCEVRLILDDVGDLIAIEADDRPRQDGRVVTACPWFGRAGGYRTIGGRRIPTKAEVGWLLDGVEFIYWRGRVESWSVS